MPTRIVLAGRGAPEPPETVIARLGRLAPHVETEVVDLYHGLDLVEPPLLHKHVTCFARDRSER